MDRITNRPEYTPVSGIRNIETDSRQKIAGAGFQEALKTAMTPTDALSSTTAAHATLPPPRAMALTDIPGDADMENRIQELIGAMEQFSAALMNPDQSFRELAPMADALGENAESLFSENIGKENPVQDFARRTALLARVEVEKFRRGDFL